MNFFFLFVDSILFLLHFFNLKLKALIFSCRYILNIVLEDAIKYTFFKMQSLSKNLHQNYRNLPIIQNY